MSARFARRLLRERRRVCRTCGSENLVVRQDEPTGCLATCECGHWSAISYEEDIDGLWRRSSDGFEMHLKRVQFTTLTTIGELWLGDWLECFTLEDAVRPHKIPKVSAIPAGRYAVVIDWSKRFGRPMPHLLDVPDFEGIRIHCGNSEADTEGCILVGRTRGVDIVGESRMAFNQLLPELERALAKDRVWIRITNEYPIAA